MYENNSIPNFLPPGLQAFRLPLIVSFFFFCQFQSTKLRQDTLGAVLVIFGGSFLNFFLFERSWKNLKNDTTFVRMCSSDHLGDAKMSKKHLALSNLTFLRIAIDENGFRRMKEEG